jgi:hypothetical protein
MTQIEAKALTLEVWRYLAEHPECYKKNMLPPKLFKITARTLFRELPLCAVFLELYGRCPRCPLSKATEYCFVNDSVTDRWHFSNKDGRKAAASRIVEIVEAWEPEKA